MIQTERKHMQARIITDRKQWNDFVAASVCCNITQSYEWAELAPHLGAEALRIGVVDDNEQLCAAMLLLITRAPVLRKTYFYAPRGPVIDDPDSPAMDILLNYILAEAHKRGAFMLKIEPSVPDGNNHWLESLRKRGFSPFFIHNKQHYEDVMRLYSDGDRAALLLAEYEGKAIAGILVLRLGRWSWYMYGASSNEQRNLMPNHLLQWTGMQWAKAHGCWYYNFRGIPDVLEEGQELWGVYLFKRGFGGYAMRFLETHDLVYKPLIFGCSHAYQSARVSGKRLSP